MSSTKLRSADYSINEIAKHSSYQSYVSKNDLRVILKKCIRDLHTLGFKVGHIKGLKAKHVYALVEHWKLQNKNTGTIKNYLSKLRELGKLLNNEKLIKSDNTAYGLESRCYYPEKSKALHQVDFSKSTDNLVRLAMEGQYLFGLRREEALKFTLSEAHTKKDFITLTPSWTKGGIGREIPITNSAQHK